MKFLKSFKKVTVVALSLALLAPTVAPCSNIVNSQAAAIKLNKTKVTLYVGKTTTLKISGTKSKVKWSTSKKSVATVSSTGKVTAKAAGTAKITAAVAKKKYTCTVTVKKAAIPKNPNIQNAPFDAADVTLLGKINFVVPKAYASSVFTSPDKSYAIASYTPADSPAQLIMTVMNTGTPAPDYSVLKDVYTETITSQLTQLNLEYTDFNTSDFATSLGTAFSAQYTYTVEGIQYNETIYILAMDNYMIQLVHFSEAGTTTTPDLSTAAQYLLNSIVVLK